MKDCLDLLLIAYEYPPVESAQGLRWWYLSRALAARGHRVRVIRARMDPATGGLSSPEGVEIIPVWPGPFVGCSARIASGMTTGPALDPGLPPRAAFRSRLEGVYRWLRRVLDQVLVPDVRSEWYPFAKVRVTQEILRQRPDWIIGSHEPGVDLALAASAARRFGIAWMADLGDPVDAAYTPRWRHRLDRWLEARWLGSADLVTVTTEGTRLLLEGRHPGIRGKVEVISQGFEVLPSGASSCPLQTSATDYLELLYTGTLYPDFRHPRPLLDALARTRAARLSFAGTAIGELEDEMSAHPQVRCLGRVSHQPVRNLQRGADVLVNLGNADPVQQPGKLIEYLAARRPILHIYQHPDDPARALVEQHSLGWALPADPSAIAALLQRLAEDLPTLRQTLPEPAGPELGKYAWPALAARLEGFLARQGFHP